MAHITKEQVAEAIRNASEARNAKKAAEDKFDAIWDKYRAGVEGYKEIHDKTIEEIKSAENRVLVTEVAVKAAKVSYAYQRVAEVLEAVGKYAAKVRDLSEILAEAEKLPKFRDTYQRFYNSIEKEISGFESEWQGEMPFVFGIYGDFKYMRVSKYR